MLLGPQNAAKARGKGAARDLEAAYRREGFGGRLPPNVAFGSH